MSSRAPTPTLQRRILQLYVRRGLLTEADAEGMPGTHRRYVGRGTGGLGLNGSVRIPPILTDADVARPILRPLRILEHSPPISTARG